MAGCVDYDFFLASHSTVFRYGMLYCQDMVLGRGYSILQLCKGSEVVILEQAASFWNSFPNGTSQCRV